MSAPSGEEFGFAPDDDAPISYMARTRDYYAAIGYTTPYRWAHYTSAPFQPLRKPLEKSRITIITTAAPFDPQKGDQGPGAKYNAGAKFYSVYDGDTSKPHDLRISHIAYDRVHTSAEDSGTWFPLAQLQRLARQGRIGEVAPRFLERRPTAAIASRSKPTRRRSSSAAVRIRSTPRCWCRTARFVIRQSASSPAISSLTALQPS